MKSKAERSRDIDRAYEELAERLQGKPGIDGEDTQLGLSYRVRRLGMAALDVGILVDLIDGNLWWRMAIKRSGRDGKDALPSFVEVEWCKRTFTGDGGAYIPFATDDILERRCIEVLVPLEQDPLRGSW